MVSLTVQKNEFVLDKGLSDRLVEEQEGLKHFVRNKEIQKPGKSHHTKHIIWYIAKIHTSQIIRTDIVTSWTILKRAMEETEKLNSIEKDHVLDVEQ